MFWTQIPTYVVAYILVNLLFGEIVSPLDSLLRTNLAWRENILKINFIFNSRLSPQQNQGEGTKIKREMCRRESPLCL